MHQHSTVAHPIDMIAFDFDVVNCLGLFPPAPALNNRRSRQRFECFADLKIDG